MRDQGPRAICCNQHKHASPKQALAMKLGSATRPWLVNEVATHLPMAKDALLPDGSVSKRHVIQTVEYNWRVVAAFTASGARGISGWQLVPSIARAI